MLKLVFLLIVIIDGEVQPGQQYWESVFVCNQYAEAVEHGMTSPQKRRHYPKESQVNITAYCTPRWVNESVEVFDR
tara:strand:- start:1101 stop:1328 length:228 start_codon:yes stop_codon:yes gene_type:complete